MYGKRTNKNSTCLHLKLERLWGQFKLNKEVYIERVRELLENIATEYLKKAKYNPVYERKFITIIDSSQQGKKIKWLIVMVYQIF